MSEILSPLIAEIRSRTQAAMDAKRMRGERVGTVPYGFTLGKDGKRLCGIADEQRMIVKMANLRKDGWTYEGIADLLNKDGIPTKTGKLWYAATVRSVLVTEDRRTEVKRPIRFDDYIPLQEAKREIAPYANVSPEELHRMRAITFDTVFGLRHRDLQVGSAGGHKGYVAMYYLPDLNKAKMRLEEKDREDRKARMESRQLTGEPKLIMDKEDFVFGMPKEKGPEEKGPEEKEMPQPVGVVSSTEDHVMIRSSVIMALCQEVRQSMALVKEYLTRLDRIEAQLSGLPERVVEYVTKPFPKEGV